MNLIQVIFLFVGTTCAIRTTATKQHKLLPLKIHGPTSFHDKIAIIGAGPSGVHMAYLLKTKGFTNIKILEKTSEIGGKSKTIYYRGAPQEMGSVYLNPDYEGIIELVNKFVPGDLVNIPPHSAWLDKLPRPISYVRYTLSYAMKYFKTKNETIIRMKLVQAIMRYIKIHKQLFGVYEGELVPEPTAEVSHLYNPFTFLITLQTLLCFMFDF